MSTDHKLSLFDAIITNINVMLGTGIFINTVFLAQRAGALGALAYIIIGALMLPLILSIAKLLELHPAGGFYTFAQKEITSLAGFFSAWSYFTGKLGSAALMIHVSMSLLQQLFPFLSSIPTIALDFFFICLFVVLNTQNMRIGNIVQKMFIGFKSVPLLTAIVVGFFWTKSSNFTAPHLIFTGIPSTFPLVIYGIIGFENACSLSSKIHNAKRNAPLAVIVSFATVISIAVLYQLAFYGALGTTLSQAFDYRGAFPRLLSLTSGNTHVISGFIFFLYLAIASSALGGAYGIIFGNTWNLHILAQNKHIFFASTFSAFNRHGIPTFCVIAQGVICVLYLLISKGNQIPLQQIGALGSVLAYTMSVIALAYAKIHKPLLTFPKLLPITGLISASLLISACIYGFIHNGITSLYFFTVLACIGITMFVLTKPLQKD